LIKPFKILFEFLLIQIVFLYHKEKHFHRMGFLSMKIGLPILLILYILVLWIFCLSFWSFITNLTNLLGFLHVYSIVFLDFLFSIFLLLIFLGKKYVTTNTRSPSLNSLDLTFLLYALVILLRYNWWWQIVARLFSLIRFNCSNFSYTHSNSSSFAFIRTFNDGISISKGINTFIPYTKE